MPYITDIRHGDSAYSTRIARFASAAALADHTVNLPEYHRASAWTGNESAASARKLAREGRPSAVRAAQALLDEIDAQGIQTYRPRWAPDVYGAMPDVPRYLAGAPDCMLRPDRRESESAPVKLFISMCVSAGVRAHQLEARGHAVLALAIKLSQFRPVELWAYADMEGSASEGASRGAYIPMIQIPTSPLDMAAASYALTSAGFLRQLCFAAAVPEGFYGSWAWRATPSYSAVEGAYERRIKEALGVGEDDLIVYGGHINNKLIAQPVAWVTEQLQRYMGQS